MKIRFDSSLKIAGIGMVPWTRLGPEQWLPNYKIASLYGWDVPPMDGLPVVFGLADEGDIPELPRLNTASLLNTSEFQTLLNDKLPGYDLLTYKPVVLPDALSNRKLLSTDPSFTNRYENKVWFRQQFAAEVTFPPFAVYNRAELQNSPEYFDRLLAGRSGMVLQDEQLSGGKGTFVITSYEQYQIALTALNRLSQHEQVVVSDLVVNAQERSIQACVSTGGVFVGPLQQQIVRHPLLANLAAAEGDKFCGAQVVAADSQPELYAEAARVTQKIGEVLQADGYKGIFGVDFLLDDKGKLFVIEVNPRITGVTPLLTALYRGDEGIPFYLLHLLELGKYEYEITDTTAEFGRTGSLLVLHSLAPGKVTIDDLPPSGTYRVRGRKLEPVSSSLELTALEPDELIFQEYMPPGIVIKPGGRMATVQFNRTVLDADSSELLPEIERAIAAIHSQIHTTEA